MLSAGTETLPKDAIGASYLRVIYPVEPLGGLGDPLQRVVIIVRYEVAAKRREGDGAFVYFSEKHSS